MIKDFASFRNLTVLTEAKEASYNTINYNNVQSITDASNIDKGSKIIIRALDKANHNTIDIKNYSSNAADNAYLIMAYNEAAYNKIIINDTLFGVASDKREGILSIIAGLSNNGHDNTLIINNLNLDEYKNNNSIFIAPSAITGLSEAKSYNNTLYIGGNLNIFKNTFIDILAGALVHYEDNYSASNAIAPSDISLSKNNRLILNTKVEARIINNFEHYYLIVSNKINTTSLLKSYDAPINISS
ncbi:periplasmic protein [Campylobacter jejuni]|uniref:Periplasmic protein n=1 Tax=Campylobacter jejuni TaxID=197 RepID=A0AAX2M2V4_CAMJU|nr:periplasmic protein [Campylobacter jejuni]